MQLSLGILYWFSICGSSKSIQRRYHSTRMRVIHIKICLKMFCIFFSQIWLFEIKKTIFSPQNSHQTHRCHEKFALWVAKNLEFGNKLYDIHLKRMLQMDFYHENVHLWFYKKFTESKYDAKKKSTDKTSKRIPKKNRSCVV